MLVHHFKCALLFSLLTPFLFGCGAGLCIRDTYCMGGPAELVWGISSLDFGSRQFSSSSDTVVTISNIGGMVASDLSSISIPSPFAFADNAYPGAGGTCGDALASGSSCTLVLRFVSPPPPASVFSGQAELSYFDGQRIRTASLALEAESDNGKFNNGQGFSRTVNSIALSGDRVLVGGLFEAYSQYPVQGLAAFNSSHEFETDFLNVALPVDAIAVPNDGSGDFYIVGTFTTVNGTSRNRIARLNADGSFDSTFDQGSAFTGNPTRLAMALDGTNDVYVAGGLVTYKGSAVSRIVRLQSTGTVSPTFTAGSFTGGVTTIAPATDGSFDIYAGGTFTNYAGAAVGRVVRINPNGTRDAAFNVGATGASSNVMAIAPVAGGAVYIGGAFTQYQGAPVGHIVRLTNLGAADAGFVTGSGFNSWVRAISTVSDGDIYVSGDFTSYNGTAVNRIVRLNSDGSIDTAFDVGSGLHIGGAFSLVTATDSNGGVYLGGEFKGYKETGSTHFLRLFTDGSIDPSFPETQFGFDSTVGAIEPDAQVNGSTFFGGQFTRFAGTSANYIVKVKNDGTRDTAFDVGEGFDQPVSTLLSRTDGSVYVGGYFSTYKGIAANMLVRLNADGSRDATFPVGSGPNNYVHSIVHAPDGSGDVYVGGWFTSFSSTGTNRILRLNEDGSRDNAFVIGTGFNNYVDIITPSTDGSGDLYVGGFFSAYQGSTRGAVVRLNSDGSLDTGFDTVAGGANNVVNAIAIAKDGSGDIYIGGNFNTYNGTPILGIARLNEDGSLDTGFDVGSGMNGTVWSLVVDSHGDIYASGEFTTYKGATANRIVRINSDGSIDSDFATGTGFEARVWRAVETNDGTGDLLIGGDFSIYNGIAMFYLGRIGANGVTD